MSKAYRPVLDIPTTPIEKTYDLTSLVIVVALVITALWSFLNLPDTIPTHWNPRGVADGFGSKYWIAFIPLLSILFHYGNSVITKIPHKFNYLKKITQENVRAEYIFGRKIIRLSNLMSQVVFGLIFYFTIRGSLTDKEDIGGGAVILLCVLMFLPVLYALVKNNSDS